ncbi:hypothetical protein DFQ27_004133 [Actinomortierella ambigua]|uniref:Uncharacterized protein n=1 Tax=Actinomortierella ambigua TaxID=1343610 RepID=A0A9P6QK71_9FUNG|nr:hypothetical protein DFQ27_004133 [Actinomortierella ambigua]
MNKNPSNRQTDPNQRSSQSHQQQASARTQGLGNQQWSGDQRSETPSHAGQSKIEAPMSGSKMCGHAHDCDCSTQSAIHASEQHAPRINPRK